MSALVPFGPRHGSAADDAACGCRLQWLQWRTSDTPFDREVQANLRSRFGAFTPTPVESPDRLEELWKEPLDGPGIRVVSCSKEAFKALGELAPAAEMELINARTVTLPLYVFAKNAPAAGSAPLRVALLRRRDDALGNPFRLERVLSAFFENRPITLTLRETAGQLAEALLRDEIDAVAIYADEPSPALTAFQDEYKPKTDPPALIVSSQGGKPGLKSDPMLGLTTATLAYPDDCFYRSPRTEQPFGPGRPGIAGIDILAFVPGMADSRDGDVPFLVADPRTLNGCCRKALDQAMSDAALMSVYAGRQQVEALDHALLLYSFLTSRLRPPLDVHDHQRELRALALAAHVTRSRGADAALPIVAAMDADSEAMASAQQKRSFKVAAKALLEVLKKEAKVARPVRAQYACDTVGLVKEASTILEGKGALTQEAVQSAWENLLEAAGKDPVAKAHKPGCGLLQVADYNPLLYLARIDQIQRKEKFVLAGVAQVEVARFAGGGGK